jgi:deazaflavin-dependent oxidoreductase (nitroreductase family)
MERTHALDRWLYQGNRPNWLARLINGASARLAAAGLGPARLVMLEVTGRRTGKTISFPVVVADYQSERYLVSMLGQGSNWVRNVRAADGRAVLRHGHREVIQLEEVDAGQRAAILRRYLECAPGARSHFPVGRGASLPEFERIAARYPVFHVTGPAGPGDQLNGDHRRGQADG